MTNNNQELKQIFRKVTPVTETEEKEVKVKPEEKTYVILYYAAIDNGEDIKSFEVITGREETYEFIKGMIESLDIHQSVIMVDNVPYSKAISIYEFMRYMKTFFMEDSFDIEDYNIGDL